MPEVVPAASLQAGNGLLGLGNNVGQILGLSLAGGAVVVLGPGWTCGVNAVSFLISAGCIAALKLPARGIGAVTTTLADLRAGWSEFRSRQWLWVIAVQYAFVVAALNANLGVLGPLIAQRDLGGAPAWSAIVLAQAVGTIVGVVIAIRLRPRHPLRVAVLVTLASALPLLTLAAGAPLPVTMAAMFARGICADIFGVLWTTTLQREIPSQAISRVSSWDLFGALAFAPLGLLLAGPVAVAVGPHAALYGCAALVVVATLAALLSPEVRRLRATSTAARSGR